ncbi:MAG: alginate export family protein [bacterium]
MHRGFRSGRVCKVFRIFAWAACLAAAGNAEAAEPWRLQSTLGLPEWLSLGVEQRTRYETVGNQFRAGGEGGDQVIAFRTLVTAEARLQGWRLGGELMDSRVVLDDSGTPLDTTQEDRTDLLQGYLAWGSKGFAGSGLAVEARGGRQTMDLGSRRLVARNSFRNTINAFTGLHLRVESPSKWQARGFFVLPVARLPDKTEDIEAGEVRFDREDPETYLWAAFFRYSRLPWNISCELYLVRLHENDTSDLATRNRRLYAPGVRWFKEPARGSLDFEVESIYEAGNSRASTRPDDTTDLDQAAHCQHAQIGYTFDVPWAPRFLVQYDYASGDRDPNDRDTERFDTLFGARRFEFGPTGIWGAFARSNLHSPGYRLIIRPAETLSTFLGHRMSWLASDRDAWVPARLQDKTGGSGDFIGHQIEGSITWNVVPKNLALETGFAYLIKGGFARHAPDAPPEDESTYFYAQTVLQF